MNSSLTKPARSIFWVLRSRGRGELKFMIRAKGGLAMCGLHGLYGLLEILYYMDFRKGGTFAATELCYPKVV